jgi:acyl-CoA synthetase (AMP-forming)/AMP-acid ligase II
LIEGIRSPQTLREVLIAHLREHESAPFVIAPETGAIMSYLVFSEEVLNIYRETFSKGDKRQRHIGFLLHNGFQATALFVGTMVAGHVSVPLNLLSQTTQLAYVLSHSDVDIVFTSTHYEAQLRAAIALCDEPTAARIRVEVIDSDALSPERVRHNRESAIAALEALPPIAAATPALLMYTSGTTGKPKGALMTHGALCYAAHTVAAWHELTPQDRVLSSLPLYHINGQCIATLAPFVSGGSIVAPHKFSVSAWWQWVDEFKPTWINVVPTIIAYLLNAAANGAGKRAKQYPAIRFARSASAPLPPDQHRAFENTFGIGVIEAMGMTECCSVVFCNPHDPSKRKYGTPGIPCGVEARVVDHHAVGETQPILVNGAIGELQLRGANLMIGYYNDDAKTREAITADGWLRTGDLGYRDDDGFYVVTGRIKELIIKGGENIAPREIDEALLAHPAVLEAAAVGIPDKDYGQDILAAIVLKPDAVASVEALRAHCLEHLGKYKTPKEFRFVAELPKGPSGKVQRLKLLDN